MTKEQKEAAYTLLKTASAYYNGYETKPFSGEMPAFTDDPAPTPAKPETEAESAPVAVPAQPDSPARDAASARLEPPSPDISFPASRDEVRLSGVTYDSIIQKVLMCDNCVLSRTRRNAVIGEGVRSPVVLVVGEGPGEEEDKTGRPFVGPAGLLLDKMLAAISLSRTSNCYIANIVKCRPPMNRAPMPDEINACMGYLQAQIHILRPKAILSVGRTSIQALLGTTQGIGALRGKWFEYGSRDANDRIPVMATYHPSALLRDAALKRPAWEDLKAFRSGLLERVPDYAEKFYEESDLH